MTETTDLALLADDTLEGDHTHASRELELATALYQGAVKRYAQLVVERYRRRLLASFPCADRVDLAPATFDNGDFQSVQGVYDADGRVLADDIAEANLDSSELECALTDLHGADDAHTMRLHPDPDPALRAALWAVIEQLPVRLQPPARLTAQDVLAGERAHGAPIAVDGLNADAERQIQHAIDCAWDRYRLRSMAAGMTVEVRCWPDDQPREGRISDLHPGASAPVTVEVDYPTGFLGPDGEAPINPANYSIERILFVDAAAGAIA